MQKRRKNLCRMLFKGQDQGFAHIKEREEGSWKISTLDYIYFTRAKLINATLVPCHINFARANIILGIKQLLNEDRQHFAIQKWVSFTHISELLILSAQYMGNGTEKRVFLDSNCLIWNGNKNTTDIYKFSSLCLLVAAQYQ